MPGPSGPDTLGWAWQVLPGGGEITKSCFALSTVTGHPGGHSGPGNPELCSHVSLGHTIVKMTVHHPQKAGRGQGCMSVGHERALSYGWVV